MEENVFFKIYIEKLYLGPVSENELYKNDSLPRYRPLTVKEKYPNRGCGGGGCN